jgi:hypothetical protein
MVTWAQQWVPSNQAALLVTTGAMWITLFGAIGPRGHRVTPRIATGLVVGFSGALMMLWPEDGIDTAFLGAQLVILLSSVAWSLGTTYRRNIRVATDPLMFAAMQMLLGGVLLTAIGLAAGELAHWQWSLPGIGAMLYLTLFGSCIAYAFYVWLIDRITPARLGATAYIVPTIAVVLGWVFLDEVLTADPSRVRYEAVHSEEGGRFLNAESRYLFVSADPDGGAAAGDLPPGYRWLSVDQLSALARHSHYVNVQARTLLACLHAGAVND